MTTEKLITQLQNKPEPYLWCVHSDWCMWTMTRAKSEPRDLTFDETENNDEDLLTTRKNNI